MSRTTLPGLCQSCGQPLPDGARHCPWCGVVIEVAQPEGLLDPLLGTSVGARYQLLEVVATGGMARVYRARRLADQTLVALKVLHGSLVGDRVQRERFLQEAAAMQLIDHPGVVTVVETGELTGGRPFLVMRFLEGESAGERLAREGALPWRRAVGIAGQLAAALEEVHRAGFIHRDLKPDNVMLGPPRGGADQVTLLDFGVARRLGFPAEPPAVSPRAPGAVATAELEPWPGRPVTDPGVVCGTPEYMGPEQVEGSEQIDARADVYGLGALLYHLVTGAPPFVAERPTEVLLQQLHEPPPLPSERAPAQGLPPALDALLLRALAKRPEERHASALELLAALEAL